MMKAGKRYATASNARRAARQDGFSLDAVEIRQEGAEFWYEPVGENKQNTEGEGAPMDVMETQRADMDMTTVEIVDVQGDSYGLSKRDDARDMAQRLANDTGLAMQVMAEGAVLDRVEPQSVDQRNPDEDDARVADELGREAEDLNGRPVMQQTADDEPVEPAKAQKVRASASDVLARLTTMKETGEPEIPLDLLDDAIAVLTDHVKRQAVKVEGPKVERAKADPTGKVQKIIELCCRDVGASPAELFEATGWHKCPWKYSLHNPKGTGWAQRFGYDMTVGRDGKDVRYFLTRPEAADAAA